jgi:signal transduction histidine kinase/HAMP domain-containing protein
MLRYAPGIRAKLIAIFILIKVVPLIALAWFAWHEIARLTDTVEKKSTHMIASTHDVVTGVSELSTQNSIRALDVKSREAIERLTTDTAKQVAAFLYDRDRDILLAAHLAAKESQYRHFLDSRSRPVIRHHPWVMDNQGELWLPQNEPDMNNQRVIAARNDDNRRDFHYHPPDRDGIVENRPLYLEMTFIDLSGMEIVKVETSNQLSPTRRNVADPANTYCRAETYFEALKQLKPGEIYVSEVIGPYVKGHLIGTYSRAKAEKQGIAFAPEKSGYAGKENPVGIRFQGLVRWGTPVLENGRIAGYVTLALDHTHIMEFTDHIVPTAECYSAISDAGSGNYAFMWDYKGRNISHPRDYFIVGYDPETGQQAVPWLDEEMYGLWQQSNLSMTAFQSIAPQFKEQALAKKPASPLTQAGMLGLDCRYLNFAPQCSGWHNLTQDGGSGSFLIFWSGLWKLTTAAAIPYYTGIYGHTPRGFGVVTIGANVDEFHRSAMETAETIRGIEADFTQKLETEKKGHLALMRSSLQKAFRHLSFYTLLMIIVVILIAIFMAAVLTTRITTIVRGIRRFQQGDRSYRLKQQSTDEMGQLAQAYNEMADTVQTHISDVEASKVKVEEVNAQLEQEIGERRRAQEELSRNRDNLEIVVKDRTRELEKEIAERRRVEKIQQQSESRLREQNNALLRLAGNEALYSGDLDLSLNTIVPLAGQTLRVDRCGVWLLDEQNVYMVCRNMAIAGSDGDPIEKPLRVADYPLYMAALRTDKTIAADDACGDDRLAELANTYLPSRAIRSLLTATVIEGGKMAGIVSFTQTGNARQWHLDEINFASSIADVVGLAIGAANRTRAMEEKEQLTARLRRAEKMEAIGTLAGGVAHDLNNILSGIVSYPELLLLQLPEDSKLREPVKTIFNSGQRAATIVQDLLTLARRGVAVTEVINLNRIVKDYLQSPEHGKLLSYHPHIRVETRLEAELMNVCGSPVHLTKSLMNLVSNAAEAILEAGRVIISTENCYIDRPFKGYDVVNEGDYVALTVSDTGTGIPPEDLNRIFEPFYTKKKMGHSGTGLGMAVVWGTVKDHLGYIDFDSQKDKGSRFTLYFPVSRKPSEDIRPQAMETYMGNGETILVVDDIKAQREIASAILTTLGYRVSTVASGEAAVSYFNQNNVDLMVLDMIMDPGMDGLDTYRQVIQRHPHQKAIVASGFSETERIREVLRLGAAVYLKKPYTIEKIGIATRSVLLS